MPCFVSLCALERFQTGLGLLEEGGDDVESAHLYQEMGRLAFRSGDNQRAMEWARHALTLAERLTADGAETEAAREAARQVPFMTMHELASKLPCECVHFLMYDFSGPYWGMIYDTPSFTGWPSCTR